MQVVQLFVLPNPVAIYTEPKFSVLTQYNVFTIWNKHVYLSCRLGISTKLLNSFDLDRDPDFCWISQTLPVWLNLAQTFRIILGCYGNDDYIIHWQKRKISVKITFPSNFLILKQTERVQFCRMNNPHTNIPKLALSSMISLDF